MNVNNIRKSVICIIMISLFMEQSIFFETLMVMRCNNAPSDRQRYWKRSIHSSTVWEQFNSCCNLPGGLICVVKRRKWSTCKVACAVAAFLPHSLDLLSLYFS